MISTFFKTLVMMIVVKVIMIMMNCLMVLFANKNVEALFSQSKLLPGVLKWCLHTQMHGYYICNDALNIMHFSFW